MSNLNAVPMGQAREVVHAIESGEIIENGELLGRLVCWCFYWYQGVPFCVPEACQELIANTRVTFDYRPIRADYYNEIKALAPKLNRVFEHYKNKTIPSIDHMYPHNNHQLNFTLKPFDDDAWPWWITMKQAAAKMKHRTKNKRQNDSDANTLGGRAQEA